MSGSPRFKWGAFTITMIGLTGLAWMVESLSTPDPDKFYQSLSPELKAKVAKNQAEIEARKPENVAARKAAAEAGPGAQIIWAEGQSQVVAPGGRAATGDLPAYTGRSGLWK